MSCDSCLKQHILTPVNFSEQVAQGIAYFEFVVIRLASMTAFGRIGEPEDIAGVVLFLASDAASWIAGQNIGVNGGSA